MAYCEMQYFLTYVLGLDRSAGKKADMGTAVHKVMECLALISKEFGDNPKKLQFTFQDKITGDIAVDKTAWMTPYMLTNEEVEYTNKSRLNKQVYLPSAKIEYGHTRYGVELVESLIKPIYDHYESKSPLDWQPIDRKHVTNWTWMTLDYQGGNFDPRKRTIRDAEPHFDFTIEKPWAKYSYVLPTNGEEISGTLSIKGTIDLITRLDSDTLEIIDFKSGRRVNWATGEVKEYEDLCDDTQLWMYYYAARKMYPDVKNIMLTIFFIRDGGPFTICLEDHHMAELEERLRLKFNEIRNCTMPKMVDPRQKDFRCQRICSFYDEKMHGTNKCKHINKEIYEIGMENVVAKYTKPGHRIDYYQNPGE